ncbi:hypothetical protein [Listeria welshimeri]|uniref:hypothetical protein n=1 Tax=Listeria welshimeri TaxID=1643 RepID=UPI0018876AD6|nr:hypothetical protein [Listeria welshimeri]MBF2595406.1 hypothetical protein [Listeria welshimeri]
MFKNKGDRLESLIQYVYQELSKFSNKDIKVENKYDIVGKSGTTHNIDVYYQFELNGIVHRVIFECKNWKSKVSKDKVLILKAIIDDIPNSVGIMVPPKGYQSGAKTFAFYCLMEKANDGKVTGTYIRNGDASGESFLILCFSKREAEEIETNLSSVVRGIDKQHLSILCDYSDNSGLKLAIKQFMSNEVLGVESNLIKDFFL